MLNLFCARMKKHTYFLNKNYIFENRKVLFSLVTFDPPFKDKKHYHFIYNTKMETQDQSGEKLHCQWVVELRFRPSCLSDVSGLK